MTGYWETGRLEHGGEPLLRQVSRHKTPRLHLRDNGREMEVSSVKRNCTDCIGRLKDSTKRWAWKWINATRRTICYRNHHLRRLDTNMDCIKEPFSSLKKGVKRRLKGNKRKTDNPGAGGSGERIGPSGPPPRPGPAVVTGGGREQEGNEPNADDESVEISAAPDENKPDWGSTASASAKLLLRGVRDSATAFGPLKVLAGHLFCILVNCEVRSPSANVTHNAHLYCSVRGKTNKR